MYKNRIRALREDRDIKQVEIAKYLGVSQNTYSDYEREKINIPLDIMIKLADYYKVSLDYIVGRRLDFGETIQIITSQAEFEKYYDKYADVYNLADARILCDIKADKEICADSLYFQNIDGKDITVLGSMIGNEVKGNLINVEALIVNKITANKLLYTYLCKYEIRIVEIERKTTSRGMKI